MFTWPRLSDLIVTSYTLAIGALGAALAYALHIPVFLLTGPALLISLVGLSGVRLGIAPIVRDVAFILIGIGIGAGVDAQAADAFLRWPLAFAALAIMLFAALILCRNLLQNRFGFDRTTAVLAASPGHLSYIIGLSESLNVDITKVAVVQSVRLLALTLCVPFVAVAFGVEVGTDYLPAGQPMETGMAVVIFAVALALGLVLKRLNVPAALLIGAMITSAVGHLTQWVPGTLAPNLTQICFLVMGTLIGTRFCGLKLADLKRSLLAGLATTSLTVLLALAAAIPAAALIDMPVAHVVIAFAPGGLETMVIMGVVLGANPGFVAACHVGRLLLLTVLVPVVLGRKTVQR
jgi:membrane AbrB-like protein